MQSLFNKANDELLKEIKESSGRMLSFKLEGLPALDFSNEIATGSSMQAPAPSRPATSSIPKASISVPKKNRRQQPSYKRDYSLSMPVHDPFAPQSHWSQPPSAHDTRQFSLSMPLEDIDSTLLPRRKSARLFLTAIERVQERMNDLPETSPSSKPSPSHDV